MRIPKHLQQALDAGAKVCLAATVNSVASIIIKADRSDILQWYGPVPIGLRAILYRGDTGSVLALEITIYESTGSQFVCDTVLNVANAADLSLLRRLVKQGEYHVHCFDSRNEYVLSKAMPYREAYRQELNNLIRQGRAHNKQCRVFDYGQAREAFFELTGDDFES